MAKKKVASKKSAKKAPKKKAAKKVAPKKAANKKHYQSAKSGRMVTTSFANANPDTTVGRKAKKKKA